MGDGFFAVQKDGITSYTRAGNFSKDKDGFLVTAEGGQVMGYPAINGAVDTGQGLVPLQLGSGMIRPPTATSTIQLRSNLDATALLVPCFLQQSGFMTRSAQRTSSPSISQKRRPMHGTTQSQYRLLRSAPLVIQS